MKFLAILIISVFASDEKESILNNDQQNPILVKIEEDEYTKVNESILTFD